MCIISNMLLLFCVVVARSCPAAALTPADFEIKELPGLATAPSFKHYSGYMPLGDAANTSMFFWWGT